MNRFRERIIHVLEILVVVVAVVAIVVGLDFIGIFNLSDVLPWNRASEKVNNHVLPFDDGSIYKALSDGKSSDTVTVVSSLSRENVLSLLKDVSISDNYYQELNVVIYDDVGETSNTKAVVSKRSNDTDVSLYSSGGILYKKINTDGEKVHFFYYDKEGNESKTTLDKGGFDLQEDTGIVMTHDRFFSENSAYADDESFYSLAYSEFGTVLLLEFQTSLEDYTALERYWLSLDYGVVTRAECYENDKLYYLLETIDLNNNY